MRRDLLATPEGRQVYDEALIRRKEMARERRVATASVDQVWRPSADAKTIPIPIPTSNSASPLTAFAPMPEDDRGRGVAWPYALIAAAAVFVAVVGALLAHGPGASPTRRPVAMTLSQVGAVHGSKFVSGGSITLAWTKVLHASVYRLQIAAVPGDPSDAVVFAHGSRAVLVAVPRYRLKVKGQQWYYWRVQALVGGLWLRYTPSSHFAVAKPGIAQPVALAPVTGVSKGGKHARLCWSRVPGAVAYRLRVQGQSVRTVHGTCVTLSLRPRTYHWSVAALVKGAGLYTGTYSVAAVLHVHAAHRTAAKAHRSHRSVRRIRTVHVTSRSGSAARTRHTTAAPVEVAFASPPRSTASPSQTRTRSMSRSYRSKVSAMGRTATRAGHVRKTHSKTHRNVTTTATKRVADVKRSGLSVPRTAGRTQHGRRTTHAPAAPTHGSKAPTKKLPPVVGSNVPPPPPPPAPLAPSVPPTNVAATTVPVPTQGVSTTGAANSSAPIYVRPIVAPDIATNTPRSSTAPTVSTAPPASAPPIVISSSRSSVPQASTSPILHQAGPAPTNTKAAPPTSSSQGTPPQRATHSDQPTHQDDSKQSSGATHDDHSGQSGHSDRSKHP